MSTEFIIPSNPADRKKIKDAIYEISGVMQQMQDKRSYIKDAKKMLKDEFGMPPKVAGRMAKAVLEHNYRELVAESEMFESTYETIFETQDGSATTASDTE